MAHGTPDWGITAPRSTIYSLHDMAELAVRMGSIVAFDRRGNVIFMDDFGRGAARVTVPFNVAPAEVFPASDYPLSGPTHLVIKTGDSAGNQQSIVATIYRPVLAGVGAEIAFVPVTNLRTFEVVINEYDGTNYRNYHARYDHTDGKLYVLDSASVWQEVGSPGVLYTYLHCYTIIKLVVDFENQLYKRLLFNDVTYDLSAHSANVSASATSPHMRVQVYAYTDADASIEVRVDNLILTQNEPM